jgi:cell division protein FtsB
MGAKLSAPAIAPAGASDAGIAAALRQALADLRQQFAQLRGDLDELRDGQQRLAEEVRTLRDALGG